MKVFILSNCPGRAYLNYLKACYPDWDIRSAVLPQAKSWIDDKHQPFLSFLAEVDVFVGLTDREPVCSLIPSTATVVNLPSFDYFTLQPDCIWLHGIKSPLNMGVIHSRIGASAWAAGKSVEDAAALFSAEHYEDLGFFQTGEMDRDRVLKKFETVGINLQESLCEWVSWGDFLYTPNHPDTRVFFDIVHLGMKAAGFEPRIPQAEVLYCRENFEDYLKGGIHWPVYSEIADHHGITVSRKQWRTSASKDNGHSFELSEMLERSWLIYDAHDNAVEHISTLLGGKDQVARLARA